MSDELPRFELPFDHAAILYATAWRIVARMQEAEPAIEERGYNTPLPRGMLTCGEAQALIPLVAILLTQIHPRLVDPEALDNAIRTAVLPWRTIQ